MYLVTTRSCTKSPSLLNNPGKKTTKRVHDLNEALLGSGKMLFIAETVQEPYTVKDVSDKFASMNKFCKDQGIISSRLFKRLDHIRIKRNDIHLQLRTTKSRSYTKAHINSTSDTIIELYSILSSI